MIGRGTRNTTVAERAGRNASAGGAGEAERQLRTARRCCGPVQALVWALGDDAPKYHDTHTHPASSRTRHRPGTAGHPTGVVRQPHPASVRPSAMAAPFRWRHPETKRALETPRSIRRLLSRTPPCGLPTSWGFMPARPCSLRRFGTPSGPGAMSASMYIRRRPWPYASDPWSPSSTAACINWPCQPHRRPRRLLSRPDVFLTSYLQARLERTLPRTSAL